MVCFLSSPLLVAAAGEPLEFLDETYLTNTGGTSIVIVAPKKLPLPASVYCP